MSETLTTLYKRNSNGKLQQWRIWAEGGAYYTEEGIVNGKVTRSKAHTCEGKNPGKANATTPEAQAVKEAKAKWEKKLATGYTTEASSVDSTGYREPMLAKKFEDYKAEVTYPVEVDQKLNGMRCNITAAGARSRKGKPIHTIPHVLKALAPAFKKHPHLFLDGELFNPVYQNNLNRLIELTSVIFQPKDLTRELLDESERIVQFHVYDGFTTEVDSQAAFVDRREVLRQLLQNVPSVHVLQSVRCTNETEVREELAKTRKARKEGIIVRWGVCRYEFKRSKYLLKLKNFESDEFEIVAVEEGNGDWVGCAKRMILKLHKPVVARDGSTVTEFAANIDGTRQSLQRMWKNRMLLPGKLATVEFQEYSEWGVPLIPWVRCIREYE